MKQWPCWFFKSVLTPVGAEPFSYVRTFFCSGKFVRLLATRVKTLCSFENGAKPTNFAKQVKVPTPS